MDTKKETIQEQNMFDGFVGVKFASMSRSYFFGYKNMNLNIGDKVVIETIRGVELGEISIAPMPMSKYTNNLPLKPIVRIASDIDVRLYENNLKDAVFALDICKKEAQKLNLNMNLISCEYTLDKTKVIFSYVADDRVDFRELLKVLASRFHTRIELRQIGPRDKAKVVGGLGICGLPLCCSTFLNEFDGISINRAKNQMLAINIPKLSGQCGKLICCLKYEDDAYTVERAKYPELGTKLTLDNNEYTITAINIISGMIKIENQEDVKLMPFADLKKQAKFKKPKEQNEKN